jgi:hypothetical protein
LDISYRHIYLGHPLKLKGVWAYIILDAFIIVTPNTKTKVTATNACGNTQLCAGLRSGIEANLHAVQAIRLQSAGWTEDSGVEEEEEDGDPQVTATLRCSRAEGLLDPNVARVRPRMIATPAMKRGPASVQLSSMPEMVSTS